MSDEPKVKRLKVSPSKRVTFSQKSDDEFGPHIIKMGPYDDSTLNRVCAKYKKMGHSVQLQNNIIKLNVIKANICLQDELMKAFQQNLLDHADMVLVSSEGQEIPCHKFVLAVRSPVFKSMFQKVPNENREVTTASADSIRALMKYLYTDNLKNEDITEDLMALAEKYELLQLREKCLPLLIKKINVENCLKMYVYGQLHNYEPLKYAAFQILDQNWEKYEQSTDLIEMMESHPQSVMEIMNRFYRKKSGFMVVAQNEDLNLKMLKAFNCLQEEIIGAFNNTLEHTDITLVSRTGQEIPCHRFILAVRSSVFRKLFEEKKSSEGLRISIGASTMAVMALVRYMYTDAIENDDISEDLIDLADKYNMGELKEYCLPIFIEQINSDNCLRMYVYGYRHQFHEVESAAFKILDENWKLYENSADFLNLMKNCPKAVLEIMSKLHKGTDCQPLILANVKPSLVDF